MKLIVLCDKSGNIQSVAVPKSELAGSLHVELEGGDGTTHRLDVDEGLIQPEALLGKKGPEAQRTAHEKLRRMILPPTPGLVDKP